MPHSHSGLGFEIALLSTNPVRVLKGGDAILRWTVDENITFHPQFEKFGFWTLEKRTHRHIHNHGYTK